MVQPRTHFIAAYAAGLSGSGDTAADSADSAEEKPAAEPPDRLALPSSSLDVMGSSSTDGDAVPSRGGGDTAGLPSRPRGAVPRDPAAASGGLSRPAGAAALAVPLTWSSWPHLLSSCSINRFRIAVLAGGESV